LDAAACTPRTAVCNSARDADFSKYRWSGPVRYQL